MINNKKVDLKKYKRQKSNSTYQKFPRHHNVEWAYNLFDTTFYTDQLKGPLIKMRALLPGNVIKITFRVSCKNQPDK